METWYRQDYDRWPDTHGHAPVTDFDFWLVMDGSVPTGTGVPFEHAEFELARTLLNRRTFGGFLVGFGTGVMIPGPFDFIAAGMGVALLRHPAGAAVGVAAYNAFGIALILLGAYMIGAPKTDFGASPMVWAGDLDWPDVF